MWPQLLGEGALYFIFNARSLVCKTSRWAASLHVGFRRGEKAVMLLFPPSPSFFGPHSVPVDLSRSNSGPRQGDCSLCCPQCLLLPLTYRPLEVEVSLYSTSSWDCLSQCKVFSICLLNWTGICVLTGIANLINLIAHNEWKWLNVPFFSLVFLHLHGRLLWLGKFQGWICEIRIWLVREVRGFWDGHPLVTLMLISARASQWLSGEIYLPCRKLPGRLRFDAWVGRDP